MQKKEKEKQIYQIWKDLKAWMGVKSKRSRKELLVADHVLMYIEL